MLVLHKQVILDQDGKPQGVWIPWEEYLQIEESLGLDLDAETVQDLLQAKADRDAGDVSSYVGLDEL